jgi:hypothetical protein
MRKHSSSPPGPCTQCNSPCKLGGDQQNSRILQIIYRSIDSATAMGALAICRSVASPDTNALLLRQK